MNNIHINVNYYCAITPLCNKTQTGITPASSFTNPWHQLLHYHSTLRKTHSINGNRFLSISICTLTAQLDLSLAVTHINYRKNKTNKKHTWITTTTKKEEKKGANHHVHAKFCI